MTEIDPERIRALEAEIQRLRDAWKQAIHAIEYARDTRDAAEERVIVLEAALKECSFRLATVVAASGDFSDVNAKALDQAQALLHPETAAAPEGQ